MPQKPLRTPTQVKADFKAKGVAVADWAKEHGFEPIAVYQVLNGFTKATRGTAHKIAVALGMKADPDKTAA